MYNYTVGVIGKGFVGSALIEHFNLVPEIEVLSYDIKDGKNISREYSKIVEKSSAIFVCLPTPNDSNGDCDVSIVMNACELLNEEAKKLEKFSIVFIKSTVKPGTTRLISEKCSHLIPIFYPEFLTERTAVEDVRSIKKHILGCVESPILYVVIDALFYRLWPETKEIIYTNFENAEMVKYITNSFFATKIIFANHIYDVCQKLKLNYDEVIKDAYNVDNRLGEIHWKVPGPDGKRGFGNTCLPKDLNALISLAKELGVDVPLLEETRRINTEVHNREDWKIKGRSIQ